LGKYDPLKGAVLEEARKLWQQVKYVIIDEMSMINYEQLRQIDLRLQQIKDNTNTFGGLHVILMGDLLQLKPVHGNWIFEQPKRYELEPNLWDLFKFYQLNINQRQQNDPVFGGLLARIRTGEQTDADIQVLTSRLLINLKNASDFEDELHLMAKKKETLDFNNIKLDQLRKKGITVYKINAVDTFTDNRKFLSLIKLSFYTYIILNIYRYI
jgi:hypothetical protein